MKNERSGSVLQPIAGEKTAFRRGVGDEERLLLSAALSALLAERSRAFQIAHDVAIAQRRAPPSVDDFELSAILRLQRTLDGGDVYLERT